MAYGIILAAIAGCYIVSSIVLFKFPLLLHKKKNVKFVCRHISHRGGAGENYENTMTAFTHAVNLGTDMLELDVHLTRDEQVVVVHDPNLSRTTHSDGSVADLDYCDLPPMKDHLPIDFMPGSTFSAPDVTDRHQPLLETVFQRFPSTPINIDIKTPNDLLITKVSDLIKKYNREHLTVWGNFSDVITMKCYKENSDICLLFSMRQVVLLILQLYTGLLPFIPLKETHLEIFMPYQIFSLYSERSTTESSAVDGSPAPPLPSPLKTPSWWMKAGATVSNALLIRPALFSHLAKRGIQTYLWVLNNDNDFHRAFKTGATGVMTDYPSKLKAFLMDNPQYLRNYSSSYSSPSETFKRQPSSSSSGGAVMNTAPQDHQLSNGVVMVSSAERQRTLPPFNEGHSKGSVIEGQQPPLPADHIKGSANEGQQPPLSGDNPCSINNTSGSFIDNNTELVKVT